MITVCILSKNSAETIRDALDSVKSFSEVLILDNGSTDNTLEIAKSYPNVRIFETPFVGFGPLRNHAAKLATHDWILALDTDESLPSALLEEINSLNLDPQIAYSMPRNNYYNGKHITGCGWSPDRVIRLYHRGQTEYSDSQVHESVNKENITLKRLKSPISHIPFRTTAEFLSKMQNYSSLFAKQYQGKRKSSIGKALFRSFFAFFRFYIIQRGFLLGAEGLIISLYNSNTVFYKYLKLWEKNQNFIDDPNL